MGKRKGSKPQYQPRKKAVTKTPEQVEEAKKARSNFEKHSTFLTVFVIVLCVVAFGGRWIYSVMNQYFDTFAKLGYGVEEAMSVAKGMDLTDEEDQLLLSFQMDWDDVRGSRLCDEVEVTADDGITLHGYYYNNDADTTVVVLQQFAKDGTEDFLPGASLYNTYGSNLLLVDARATGKSEGEFFSYGYQEQYDLIKWIEWLKEQNTDQKILLWGIGSGANTALFADLNGILPDNVTGIVAESPYASLHDLAKVNIKEWYTLSAFPFLNAIELRLNLSKAPFKMEDLNLTTVLASTPQDIPVLFLECGEDAYIQPQFTNDAYQAFLGEKEIIVGNGNHGTVFPEKEEEIMTWIKNNVKF